MHALDITVPAIEAPASYVAAQERVFQLNLTTWALLVIAFDVLVIWAVTVHGTEFHEA